MEKDWEIEYMYLKNVRLKYDWTHPKFLVDWLLESNFHVLLCQGIHNGMFGSWKPIDYQHEILRLQNHSGFPNGLHLQDPVLNADKLNLNIFAQFQIFAFHRSNFHFFRTILNSMKLWNHLNSSL